MLVRLPELPMVFWPGMADPASPMLPDPSIQVDAKAGTLKQAKERVTNKRI
jgi:hypothetical protein